MSGDRMRKLKFIGCQIIRRQACRLAATDPHEQKVREILSVPAHLRVRALTPIGKSRVEPKRPPRPEPAEATHRNTFGGDP